MTETRSPAPATNPYQDPETIRRILVTDAAQYGEGKWTLRGERVMRDCLITRDGDPHRERRALLQPAFERRRLAGEAQRLVEPADTRRPSSSTSTSGRRSMKWTGG